jgi:hypothetical protein
LFAALKASCNFTRENVLRAIALTEKNSALPVSKAISKIIQPIKVT